MPIAKVSPELAEGQPKNIAADPIELARELAKQFTETAAERDDQGATAWHEGDLIRNSGLLRLIIPKSSGGFGSAWPTVMGVVRTIATADGSLAHVLGFHNLQLVTPHVIGSREQRTYYYEQTAKQNWFWEMQLIHLKFPASIRPESPVGKSLLPRMERTTESMELISTAVERQARTSW